MLGKKTIAEFVEDDHVLALLKVVVAKSPATFALPAETRQSPRMTA